MSFIIGADIMPEGKYSECLGSSRTEEIVSPSLHDYLIKADCTLFNLELPLTDTITPIKKIGKNKRAGISCAKGIQELGIKVVNLANNHCMDQDIQGLFSTMRVLDEQGIRYVGAGENIDSASVPIYIERNKIKYGIYSCAEHEFTIARDQYPGANPYDPLVSFDQVEQMKEKCDFRIVLYHGGKEYYQYPSPQLQKVCRTFIRKGADLVICQHNHIIACKELYHDGTIVYGQGDFMSIHSGVNEGNCLLIQIDEDRSITFVPVINNGIRLDFANGKQKIEILDAFNNRSKEIMEPGVIDKKYAKLAEDQINKYLTCFLGLQNNVIMKVMNKLTNNHIQQLIAQRYKKKYGLDLRNYIECEAHRELLLRGLSE